MPRMTWIQIEGQYGPQNRSDTPLARRCRLLQSWYRVNVLGETQCGPYRAGGRCVGNVLVNGKGTGANFLTRNAFEYAKARTLDKLTNPALTIDEYRLFNNMLSSQPMCFNFFADLRSGVLTANSNSCSVLRSIFVQSRIAGIHAVEVEMIPLPTHAYIDDNTAFDAAILFTDQAGQNGIATIETKYADHLGANRAGKEGRKRQLADEISLFTRTGCSWYAEKGFDQVARNLLLTLAFARKHNCPNAVNYVVSLSEDCEAERAVESLRSRLADKYRDCIRWLPLEKAMATGLEVATGEVAAVLRRFQKRYLDFAPVDKILRTEP